MTILIIILLLGGFAYTQVRKSAHDRELNKRADKVLEGEFEEIRTTKHD
jgi:hypothetical protein